MILYLPHRAATGGMLFSLSVDTLRISFYNFLGTDDINIKDVSCGGIISTNYPTQVLLLDDIEEIYKA